MGPHPCQNYIQAIQGTGVGDKASGFGDIAVEKLPPNIVNGMRGNLLGPTHL